MKGIVLAGGTGTRLYPVTSAINKHLLPVYDKPMIYYPLSVLMLAGIRDILIISTPRDLERYRELFGSGEQLGMHFFYAEQPAPDGIPQAFSIGRRFIGDASVALVLGDNLFVGGALSSLLQGAAARDKGATIFAHSVQDSSHYGVVSFDKAWRPMTIEEKPRGAKSAWAVTGLYFYDNRVLDIAGSLKPSARGELEISDVNNIYLGWGELSVERLDRGFAWFDAGTFDSLLEASEFVRAMQHRQARPIACLEEIAFNNGWIDLAQLEVLCKNLGTISYAGHLRAVIEAVGRPERQTR